MSVIFDFPPYVSLNITRHIMRDLRSDHAGETGAVYIYKRILSSSTDCSLVNLSKRNLEIERQHL